MFEWCVSDGYAKPRSYSEGCVKTPYARIPSGELRPIKKKCYSCSFWLLLLTTQYVWISKPICFLHTIFISIRRMVFMCHRWLGVKNKSLSSSVLWLFQRPELLKRRTVRRTNHPHWNPNWGGHDRQPVNVFLTATHHPHSNNQSLAAQKVQTMRTATSFPPTDNCTILTAQGIHTVRRKAPADHPQKLRLATPQSPDQQVSWSRGAASLRSRYLASWENRQEVDQNHKPPPAPVCHPIVTCHWRSNGQTVMWALQQHAARYYRTLSVQCMLT